MSENCLARCFRPIQLHGWDARLHAWHGPDELTFKLTGCRRILGKLRQLPGSWYGRLRAEVPGGVPLSFCASIHDLGDAGLASLDLDGSPHGPMEVLLVITAQRRSKIRPDLAFEFAAELAGKLEQAVQERSSAWLIRKADQRIGERPGCGDANPAPQGAEWQPKPPAHRHQQRWWPTGP